ncbi:PilW family protein [Nocardioides pacificus]
MTPTTSAAARRTTRDEGVTLIEVLVGMGLFTLVGTLLLGLGISTSQVTTQTRERTGVVEESRIAMERIARELRQASSINSVTLPATAQDPTTITFWTDFDGDTLPGSSVTDPEILTYTWTPPGVDGSAGRLTLQGGGMAQTVLSAGVTAFTIELRSSLWEYDANGDGKTTWEEIDAVGPPISVANGLPDNPDLNHIDLVALTMTVEDGGASETYQTMIDMRNRT